MSSSKDSEPQSEIDEADERQPAGQRWDPLGAANEDADLMIAHCDSQSRTNNADEITRIKSLEEEQEMLSSSLLALTSHFAQVQLRLRQIVSAPPEQRDQLLQNLDEFAFRGIPEINKLRMLDQDHLIKTVERQRANQFELIEQLKLQLMEVEKFAFESGAKVLPQSMLLEKQRVIIDEFKNKVNLKVCDDDLPQLTSEDLRQHVDSALGEFVGPIKMKDTLVGQLKTQIADLERFVAYLQLETYDLKQMTKAMAGFKNCDTVYNTYNTKVAKNRRDRLRSSGGGSGSGSGNGGGSQDKSDCNRNSRSNPSTIDPRKLGTDANENLSRKAATLLDKASSILNMFAMTQFGCGTSGRFRKNTLKKTSKGNHWGDLRAELEVDIQEIISLVSTIQQPISSSDSDDSTTVVIDSSMVMASMEHESYNSIQLEITRMVRKHFAVTLQKLIEHGLREPDLNSTSSLVPFRGCFSHATTGHNNSHTHSSYSNSNSSSSNNSSNNTTKSNRRYYRYSGYKTTTNCDDSNDDDYNDSDFMHSIHSTTTSMHAWELILQYYHIKNGEQFNDTPARKLSQSFNLDISGISTASNKQSLLSTIGTIISLHAPYKRSYNSHFKALVSYGLNTKKLTNWLNLIFQCTELIQQYYTDSSYVARTGFRDALKSIDRLSQYNFHLPADIAVRQFQNIKDVFM